MTQPSTKYVPNCDDSFANGELHQAYGHMTLTMEEANCMNRDGGAYNLQTTYDRILVTRSSSTSCDHMPDEVRRWRTKRRS